MTDKQFWMKADQVSESHKPIEKKAEAMAALLKTAYEEGLNMIILYKEKRKPRVALLHKQTEGRTRSSICTKQAALGILLSSRNC